MTFLNMQRGLFFIMLHSANCLLWAIEAFSADKYYCLKLSRLYLSVNEWRKNLDMYAVCLTRYYVSNRKGKKVGTFAKWQKKKILLHTQETILSQYKWTLLIICSFLKWYNSLNKNNTDFSLSTLRSSKTINF